MNKKLPSIEKSIRLKAGITNTPNTFIVEKNVVTVSANRKMWSCMFLFISLTFTKRRFMSK